jgi:cytochrome c553
MIPSRAIAAVVLGLVLGASLPLRAADGDPAAGKQKNQMCEGCHGVAGFRTAYPVVYSTPKLGGQNTAYIVKALHDYKAGARKHPSMNGIAASLSDKDMADLAAYYGVEAK